MESGKLIRYTQTIPDIQANRGSTMPTKQGLTRLEHEELGRILKQLRDEALGIALVLETAYAKQSPCARLSYRAA